MLNWNGWEETVRSLDSLFQSDYLNFDVVLLDNASSDESLSKLTSWLTGKGGITLLTNQENEGFTGGMNRAIAHALAANSPDFIFLLNNDTIVDKACLGNCVSVAQREGATVVGALIKSIDDSRTLFTGASPEREFFFGTQPKDERALPEVWETGRVEGSGALISATYLREHLARHDYIFDPRLFLYGDDVDFGLAVRKAGKKIFMSKSAVVFHELGLSMGGVSNPRQYYYITRNRILLANRWLTTFKKISFHCYFFPSRVIRVLQRILQGKFVAASAIVDALIDGYSGRFGKWKKHDRFGKQSPASHE